MSSFSLLEQDSLNTAKLPKKTLKNTLIVSQSFLLAGTVNLNQAKDFVPQVRSESNLSSHADYKLLTRYFDQGNLVDQASRKRYEKLMSGLQSLCWMLLFQSNSSIKKKNIRYLNLDGTKWDYGDGSIHLLTLCIIIGDVSVPIWWEDIEKAGHSSQKERITYLKAAMEKYDLGGMILLADREYIGRQWFKELEDQGLYFVIRVKEGIYHDEINRGKGLGWSVMKARALKKKKGKKISKKIILNGISMHYIILKNPRPNAEDELIFLLSNWTSATQASKMYELRWQIEVCFKHFKSNGLNLEDMNVQGKEKRHLMMAISVLVYIIIIREGILEEHRAKSISIKKDSRTGFYYRTISIFRKGLSAIRKKVFNLKSFIRYLEKSLNQDFKSIF